MSFFGKEQTLIALLSMECRGAHRSGRKRRDTFYAVRRIDGKYEHGRERRAHHRWAQDLPLRGKLCPFSQGYSRQDLSYLCFNHGPVYKRSKREEKNRPIPPFAKALKIFPFPAPLLFPVLLLFPPRSASCMGKYAQIKWF